MHLPFTPNHVQLISACYPPNAALLTAGPDYRPNVQELSRMTYYASNRPGKINKLASELEKRARLDCRKAKAGNIRARSCVGSLSRTIARAHLLQISTHNPCYHKSTCNRVPKRPAAINGLPAGLCEHHSHEPVVGLGGHSESWERCKPFSLPAAVLPRNNYQFTAWTTYTDGHLIGVDQSITQDYMSCLKVFSDLSRGQSKDQEMQNR